MKFLAFGLGGGGQGPKLSMARRHWLTRSLRSEELGYLRLPQSIPDFLVPGAEFECILRVFVLSLIPKLDAIALFHRRGDLNPVHTFHLAQIGSDAGTDLIVPDVAAQRIAHAPAERHVRYVAFRELETKPSSDYQSAPAGNSHSHKARTGRFAFLSPPQKLQR